MLLDSISNWYPINIDMTALHCCKQLRLLDSSGAVPGHHKAIWEEAFVELSKLKKYSKFLSKCVRHELFAQLKNKYIYICVYIYIYITQEFLEFGYYTPSSELRYPSQLGKEIRFPNYLYMRYVSSSEGVITPSPEVLGVDTGIPTAATQVCTFLSSVPCYQELCWQNVILLKKKKRMQWKIHMAVSENRGTPKSSILIGVSIINHPFWGTTIFGNTHMKEVTQKQKNTGVSYPNFPSSSTCWKVLECLLTKQNQRYKSYFIVSGPSHSKGLQPFRQWTRIAWQYLLEFLFWILKHLEEGNKKSSNNHD